MGSIETNLIWKYIQNENSYELYHLLDNTPLYMYESIIKESLLQYTIMNGLSLDIISLLIDSNADLNYYPHFGPYKQRNRYSSSISTPLRDSHYNPAITRLLLSSKADLPPISTYAYLPPPQKQSPYNIQFYKTLLEYKSDINGLDGSNNHLFHYYDNLSVIQFLLDNDGNPNILSCNNYCYDTPLHKQQNSHIISLLLQYNANINALNIYQQTPIMSNRDYDSIMCIIDYYRCNIHHNSDINDGYNPLHSPTTGNNNSQMSPRISSNSQANAITPQSNNTAYKQCDNMITYIHPVSNQTCLFLSDNFLSMTQRILIYKQLISLYADSYHIYNGMSYMEYIFSLYAASTLEQCKSPIMTTTTTTVTTLPSPTSLTSYNSIQQQHSCPSDDYILYHRCISYQDLYLFLSSLLPLQLSYKILGTSNNTNDTIMYKTLLSSYLRSTYIPQRISIYLFLDYGTVCSHPLYTLDTGSREYYASIYSNTLRKIQIIEILQRIGYLIIDSEVTLEQFKDIIRKYSCHYITQQCIVGSISEQIDPYMDINVSSSLDNIDNHHFQQHLLCTSREYEIISSILYYHYLLYSYIPNQTFLYDYTKYHIYLLLCDSIGISPIIIQQPPFPTTRLAVPSYPSLFPRSRSSSGSGSGNANVATATSPPYSLSPSSKMPPSPRNINIPDILYSSLIGNQAVVIHNTIYFFNQLQQTAALSNSPNTMYNNPNNTNNDEYNISIYNNIPISHINSHNTPYYGSNTYYSTSHLSFQNTIQYYDYIDYSDIDNSINNNSFINDYYT